MCFHRTKLYKSCGHTEFRRFMCNSVPLSNNDNQSDLDSSDQVYIKGRFACGEPPEHVDDMELGLCGRCRKTRYPRKGAGRRRAVLDKEPSEKRAGAHVFLSDRYAEEPKHGGESCEQPSMEIFLSEFDAREPDRDEKTEDDGALPAEDIEEWRLFKQSSMEAVEDRGQVCDEVQDDQPRASPFLAIGNLTEYCPKTDKHELPVIINSDEKSKESEFANNAPADSPRYKPNRHTLSHSATKVRRDLYAARGRVRSMIEAFNGKSEVGRMISSIDNRRMVTSMANTINRTRKPDHSAKRQPPVARKEELAKRPLPFPPYPDVRTLSKPAKLQVLAKHRYHRLVPIQEESTSQALVVANSVEKTVVLRRAKAIKVRNLNAFHCPVREPRFGLRRKILAPPVPRHSTPPVAVPFSKFADLGRRRVSELEWCFVV